MRQISVYNNYYHNQHFLLLKVDPTCLDSQLFNLQEHFFNLLSKYALLWQLTLKGGLDINDVQLIIQVFPTSRTTYLPVWTVGRVVKVNIILEGVAFTHAFTTKKFTQKKRKRKKDLHCNSSLQVCCGRAIEVHLVCHQ